MTDRTWYANIHTPVDMSVNTRVFGRVKEPKRGQRGKTTDCRVQNSPCWARCRTAFLYGVNIFKWIKLEVERCPALVVKSRSIERVKVEKAGRGNTVLRQPISYAGLSYFGQVKPRWISPQPKAAARHALVLARGRQAA